MAQRQSAIASTTTTTTTIEEPVVEGTIHLQAPETEESNSNRSGSSVRWTEEVIDNEHMNKKKSKSMYNEFTGF